jgi:putative hemolysin
MDFLIECIVILVLISVNAYFALSEFAIISAKKARLRQKSDEGDTGAAEALRIAQDPISFLSTIQIGITVVGIFAGAYGGATLAQSLAPLVGKLPQLAPYQDFISIFLVVLIITYLTLVFGEIIPKRIAMDNAESIASAVARPMRILSYAVAPAVFVLTLSTEIFLRILGLKRSQIPSVTEEEIKIMLEEGAEKGVFDTSEVNIIEEIFNLGDRNVSSVMTRRVDMIGVNLNNTPDANYQILAETRHSYFPVYRGVLDNIVGVISVKDLWASAAVGSKPDIEKTMRKPYFIPESFSVMRVLEAFKKSHVPVAIVTDEYGSIEGMITLYDILESIIGGFQNFNRPELQSIRQCSDGSWLVDGDIFLDDLKEIISVDKLPERGVYQTLSGFIMYLLQRIPETGDIIEFNDFRLEVVDMIGNRVDKVLLSPLNEKQSSDNNW